MTDMSYNDGNIYGNMNICHQDPEMGLSKTNHKKNNQNLPNICHNGCQNSREEDMH